MQVALLDDQRSIVELLTTALSLHGHQAIPFSNGADLLNFLFCYRLEHEGRLPFRRAILDIQVPGMDGIEVTQRIRETIPARELPILLISGSGPYVFERAERELPGVPILHKPFKIVDIVHFIETSPATLSCEPSTAISRTH